MSEGGDRVLDLVREDVSEVFPIGSYAAKRCPVVTQNDILQPGEEIEASAFSQHLFDKGDEFELEMFEELRNRGALLIEADDEQDRIDLTTAAMRDRVEVILDARLPDDTRRKRAGRPDVLILARGGGYRAADVKSHKILQTARTRFPAIISSLDEPLFEDATREEGLYARRKEGDLLQIAHYQRMLEAMGMAASDGRFAAIISKEGLVAWFDLDEKVFPHSSLGGKRNSRSVMERYDFEFAFRLDVAARALRARRGGEAELLPPVRIPECDRCAWHDVCLEQLSAEDGDISLLPGIGYAEWREHTDRGISTRDQLAALDAADPRYADWPSKGLEDHIDNARAWMGSDPFYLRRDVDRFDLPEGDVEIDIDLESYLGHTYLWGALVTQNDSSSFHHFATWEHLDETSEREAFTRFWSWLSSTVDGCRMEGKSVRIFHFADIERTTMRKLARAAGIEQEVSVLIDSDAFVDLHRTFSKQLITGTAMGLKVLAPLAGFRWEVEDPGGAVSMVRFEEAVRGSQEARDWLLAYNEGDVRATLAIRRALRRSPPGPLPVTSRK